MSRDISKTLNDCELSEDSDQPEHPLSLKINNTVIQ